MSKPQRTLEYVHFRNHMATELRYAEEVAQAGENLITAAMSLGLPPNRRTLGFVAEILNIDVSVPGRLAETFYSLSGLQEMGAPSPEELGQMDINGIFNDHSESKIDSDPRTKSEQGAQKVLDWLQETTAQDRMGYTRENRRYLEDVMAEIVLPKTMPFLRDAVENALVDPDVAPMGVTLSDRFIDATLTMQQFVARDLEAAAANTFRRYRMNTGYCQKVYGPG